MAVFIVTSYCLYNRINSCIIFLKANQINVLVVITREVNTMADNNSLIPVVTNAVVTVSGNITNFITKARASGFIQRAQLDRANHVGDIVTTHLEQLARAQERIDSLERQGRLHDSTLAMAMDQLGDLNDILRRNLRNFENRGLR